MKRHFGFFALAALLVCAALVLGLSACSSGGDDDSALLAVTSGGGGTNTTTPTPEPTPTSTPAATYTVTFNANDGSQNPATATQSFTEGTSQALKTISELGFSKGGFSFAGWGKTADATESAYADGASYTATAAVTLYAIWSAIPVYSVNVSPNANGNVTASPATGIAGTEITLSNTPEMGYKFSSYAVTDEDGAVVTVTDGKFKMPAKNVTVTAVFTAMTYTITFNANDGSQNPATATQTFTTGIPQALKTISELGFSKDGSSFAGWGISADATESSYADGAEYTASADLTLYALWSEVLVYSVNILTSANGSIMASPAMGIAGTEITLSNTPNAGYKFSSYTVTDADGTVVTVTDGKFTMPAKNVTVMATFIAIHYNVNVGTFANGSVTASPTTETVGNRVTLTATPASGYRLDSLVVTDSDGTHVGFLSMTGNYRTFRMPAKNVTVTATFKAIYNINLGTIVNGSVTIPISTASAGTKIRLSNKPNEGYNFGSYTVTDADGTVVDVADGVFTMPAKNVTVTATFIAIKYKIKIDNSDYGYGNVKASAATASVGTCVNLTITPASGCELTSLTVTDSTGAFVSVDGTGNNRAFVMPAKQVNVKASFRVIQYNINVGAVANGSVTAIYSTAPAGMTISLSNKPNEGYKFDSYTVTDADGAVVTVANGNFTMPAKNVNVTATFSAINYNINVITNGSGSVTITPATATATVGETVTLTATPAIGYYDSVGFSVTDEVGVPVTASRTDKNLTFTMPAKNVTVTVQFYAIYYSINVAAAYGTGFVTASHGTAKAGEIVTLTADPMSGYGLDTLAVTDKDGDSVILSGTGNSRTFTMPAKNVTVTATFIEIPCDVNIETFANGRVTANPTTAMVGTEVTLKVTPDSGYWLSSLAVEYDDGLGGFLDLSGSGYIRTFTMPRCNVKVTATFSAMQPVASGGYVKTGTKTIEGKEYDLVTFGLWPQTIKAENVEIDESKTETHGAFTYCKGSDGQWYVKQVENGKRFSYDVGLCKYSDGTEVAQGGTSEKWFKVEPIKWRVLTTNYDGKKLLLAENILTSCAYHDCFDRFQGVVTRTIGGKTVYSNNYEYSRIRAFLNGLGYQKKTGPSSAQTACDDFLGKGFLQSAFNAEELAIIQNTSVDNSARSTYRSDYAKTVNNEYAGNVTTDKVFLLSVQDVTTTDYGTNDTSGEGNMRIRQTTDFAKASGAHQSAESGMGGEWWLRSPCGSLDCEAYLIQHSGDSKVYEVHYNYFGVVPALCVGN